MFSSLSLIFSTKDEPVFKYEVEKGIECITDKVSVYGDYVVMVPSWPLEAQAIVMTLDINNKMVESGKYLVSGNISYFQCKNISFLSSSPTRTPRAHWTRTGNTPS